MKLTREDFHWLIRFDKAGKVDEIPKLTLEKLCKAGLIDENFDTTAEGVETIDKVQTKLAELKSGVPLSQRSRRDPVAFLKDKDKGWFTGSVARKAVVTNCEILFFGKPVAEMESKPLEGERKNNLPSLFTTKGEYKKLFPRFYQTDGKLLEPMEWIWFTTSEKAAEPQMAIQAKYYDFLEDKFGNGEQCTWMGVDYVTPIRLLAKDKGVTESGIVALVMPCDTNRLKGNDSD